MTAVHQFVPTLAPRDAVGGHYLAVRDTLRDSGYASEIYALEAKHEYRRRAHPYRQFSGARRGEATWIMYHCSVGSPVAEFVAARPEPLVVDYHNVTPASFFAPWEPHLSPLLSAGRRQLAELSARAAMGLADSAFNAAELDALGYQPTAVVPILFDVATFEGDPDARVRDALSAEKGEGGSDWLFVGRLAPNKAQHDLVKAFAAFRRAYDPRARLHLVGASSSHAYETALRGFIGALGLGDAVRLHGAVPAGALAAHYDSADVFVCLSEHEGFCVPLLEAMFHGLPIVAYGVTAVGETLAGAGIVLARKTPTIVASAAHMVLNEVALREHLVELGHARLGDFSIDKSRRRLLDALVPLVGSP